MVVQDSHIQAKSYRTTLARSVTVTNGTYSQFFPEISYLDPTTNERRREMSLVKSVDIWHRCNCVELKKTKYSIIRSNIQHKLGYRVCTQSASYEKKVQQINIQSFLSSSLFSKNGLQNRCLKSADIP